MEVYWFQYEVDSKLNSNAYQVANRVVNEHYPGEFGSERMVQQVVDHILKVTATSSGMEQVVGVHPDPGQVPTPSLISSPQDTSHDNTAAGRKAGTGASICCM